MQGAQAPEGFGIGWDVKFVVLSREMKICGLHSSPWYRWDRGVRGQETILEAGLQIRW